MDALFEVHGSPLACGIHMSFEGGTYIHTLRHMESAASREGTYLHAERYIQTLIGRPRKPYVYERVHTYIHPETFEFRRRR